MHMGLEMLQATNTHPLARWPVWMWFVVLLMTISPQASAENVAVVMDPNEMFGAGFAPQSRTSSSSSAFSRRTCDMLDWQYMVKPLHPFPNILCLFLIEY